MKFKVGDKVKIRKGSLAGNIYTISHIESCGHIELSDLPYVFFDYELEPVDSKTLRMADGTIIGEFDTGGVLPTSEWSKLIFKNGSSIEVLPQKDDTVRGKNHFCDGFRGGKIPTSGELIVSHTEMERAMDALLKALEKPGVKFDIKNLNRS